MAVRRLFLMRGMFVVLGLEMFGLVLGTLGIGLVLGIFAIVGHDFLQCQKQHRPAFVTQPQMSMRRRFEAIRLYSPRRRRGSWIFSRVGIFRTYRVEMPADILIGSV